MGIKNFSIRLNYNKKERRYYFFENKCTKSIIKITSRMRNKIDKTILNKNYITFNKKKNKIRIKCK